MTDIAAKSAPPPPTSSVAPCTNDCGSFLSEKNALSVGERAASGDKQTSSRSMSDRAYVDARADADADVGADAGAGVDADDERDINGNADSENDANDIAELKVSPDDIVPPPTSGLDDDAATDSKNKISKPSMRGETDSCASEDDPFAKLDELCIMDLFPVSNYTFGIKNEKSGSKLLQAVSRSDLVEHLRASYQRRGIRRSVGAVILVHNHRFPHLLLLQRRDGRGEFVLPGGRLRPGESNEDGLQRKLVTKLTPSSELKTDDTASPDVGEKLCSWYAIDFDRRYFPYVPAHVTKPKEELHIYAVSLPSKFTFAVPNDLQLVAVPIFDVFNNHATYGDVISAIPSVLSKYHFNFC